MDSPNADLSPNAPFQKGFDELTQQHVNPSDNSVPPAPGQTSAEGSLDSSGFEKVDHDILDQYSQEFKNQLDQAAFGRLPDDPDNRTVTGPDSGTEEDVGSSFVIVQKPEEMTDKDKVQELSYAGDGLDVVIPVPVLRKEVKPVEQQKQMSDHRDNVIEKDYGHFGRESPTDETARRIVNDAVQAAREGMGDISPHGIRSVDDYFPDPHQAAQQAHDDLLDIRDDLVPHHNDFLPEPPKANVHDEVDDMLNRMRANDEAQEQYRPKDYDLDMDQPDFRSQTPEPEETTFNRQGPLTIPSQQIPEEDDLASFDQIPHGHFETEPRPPTPPKELSDEDVKPSVVDLGPPTHVHHDQPHHSILKHGHGYGEPWFDFKTVDPRILDLIYWRDPKKSGIALALSLLFLFILGRYPILSVIAYTGLAVLAATLGFRIYKAIEGQIKKTGSENPFQPYLNQDLSLPQDRVHSQVDVLVEHGSHLANQLKRLIFVENIVDSVKFGLLLWSLTYIASWFSGFTLALLTILGIFSIPKFYETYQEPIDHHLGIVKGHIDNITTQLEEKVPFLRRQAAVEKKDQ